MTYRIYTPLPSKNLAILTLQFDHVTVKTIYKSVKLERKDCIKYLGVLKDENLSCRKHIVTVTSKISKTIGMLSKLRHFIPSSVLVNIYNALITAYLTYGLVSWGNACKTYLDKIRVLQKRALLLIYSANRQDRAIPLLLNAKVLPLNFLSCESVLSLMHDIDERNSPINIFNLFSRTSNSHHYSTRSSPSQNFYIKKNLDLMYKRMRSLAMAQRYGMRCQIAFKTKHIKEDLQEKKTNRSFIKHTKNRRQLNR